METSEHERQMLRDAGEHARNPSGLGSRRTFRVSRIYVRN